ncbi:MAG: MBL fold metallo-hydrolase [Dehalococcoidia bacterium]
MQVYEEEDLRLVQVGPLGPFNNNAYLIVDPAASEALLVDMPAQGDQALAAAEGLRLAAVVLTHTHPDHWAAYDLIKGATGAPVHCHPAEVIMPADRIDVPLADGQELSVGRLPVKVIHTPGHTPGSVCLLVGRHLISGDTLFPGGPGHSRSPQDLQQEIRSIVERLYILPDSTLVHPGHGDGTTIGHSMEEYADFAARPHPPDLHGDVLWRSA